MDLSESISGRVALVTGASSGLGEHLARVLARAGASVVLAARRLDRLERIAGEIRDAGHRAHAVEMDVTRAESVEQAVAAAGERGEIRILVNNSGTVFGSPAMEVSEADWDRVLDTNLKGAWLVAQATARHMAGHRSGGSIVNMASLLGIRATKGVAPYAVSKAGLIQMTCVLALEWARYDIRVNAIAPSYIETDLNRDFLRSDRGEAIRKRIPMRRFGEPGDLDGIVLLLASDASRFITGTVMPVDGGHAVAD